MIKKQKSVTPTDSQMLENDKAIDILKLEYNSLLTLYTHTENAINGIFSFYITLFSAIIGAIIVLFQINSANLFAAYPSIAGLLVFVILTGVITQDSIVIKNINLSNFTLGLNLLKYRLYKDYEAEKSYIFYLHNFWAKVSPLEPEKIDFVAQVHKKMWWFFPLGTHQLFISIVSSFSLGVLTVILVQLISVGLIPIGRIVLGGIFVTFVSFQVNNTYAQLIHKSGLKRFKVVSNTKIPWSENAG